MAYAKKNGASLAAYSQVSYTPFEPSTKRAEGIVEMNGKKFKAIKGAPQMVISICSGLTKEQKDEADAKIESLSRKGCRVLAVAKSAFGDYGNLTLAGLIALSDPLRPDSTETIAALRAAGIQPIMLTGDNIAVAREMAKQAGIGSSIVRISEIKALPESEQANAVEKCDGIAEIYPEDKYWVVRLLQSGGKTVGMTGDGVNDAPALKQAELGIAVSSSTDVAKAAAGLVLTEPGTKAILEGVRISRETYQRMLTWTLKKITFAIQFMVVLSIGFFWLKDVVISIPGLMLLMIVSDFITMSLAVDNSRGTKSPNSWNVKNITIAAVFMGIFLCGIMVALLAIGIGWLGLGLDQIRTLVIIGLVFTGQFTIIVVRERGHFWDSRPARLVSATIAFSIIAFAILAMAGIALTPLAPTIVLAVLAASALYTFAMDWPKEWLFKRFGIS
jgi:H+-transporting ATPase